MRASHYQVEESLAFAGSKVTIRGFILKNTAGVKWESTIKNNNNFNNNEDIDLVFFF